MSKVFVRLKDGTSVFHDQSQGLKIVGKKVAEARRTPKVNAALLGGHLVKISQEEYDKGEKAGERQPVPALPKGTLPGNKPWSVEEAKEETPNTTAEPAAEPEKQLDLGGENTNKKHR